MACGSEPAPSTAPLSQDVSDDVGTAPPSVALDLLWVIDNSKSMCVEQLEVAARAQAVVERLEADGVWDYRMAVVTTDMLSSDWAGRFRHHPLSEFCFACAAVRFQTCDPATDAGCGPGWQCNGPQEEAKRVNCNGSTNVRCKRDCASDAECDAQLVGAAQGAACDEDVAACRYKCLQPNADPSSAACIPRSPNADCPSADAIAETLGPGRYVTAKTSDLWRCISPVGAESHSNTNLEQGFNAALAALEPNGPNAAQATGFLRPDALLGVIFVTDDDDCSVADGVTMKKEVYGTCQCLDDASAGGPLRTVDDVATRLKALKGEPEKVYVAALIGDSTADDAAAMTAERDAYRASKCGLCEEPSEIHPLLFNTSICTTTENKADFGRRYVALVDQFGDRGVLANLCAASPVDAMLDRLLNRMRANTAVDGQDPP